MAWHLALFHLEAGDHDRVLGIYDTQVRPRPTDDFRDVANAVSLLWRLEQEGVSVGGRWGELGAIAMRRRRDTTLTFASLHNLLALIAMGEIDAAWELVDALETSAAQAEGDQGQVMEAVGIELATTLLDLALNRAPRSDFASLASRLAAPRRQPRATRRVRADACRVRREPGRFGCAPDDPRHSPPAEA